MMTAVIGAVLMTLLTLSLAQAQGTTYDLRSAEFTLPPGWTQTHSSRDQSYDFTSPDGRYQLWARWWFPDEPLLGYDDIVRHEKRSLAGQEALFIHTEIGSQRMLQLAFLQEDAEGEIFLWQVSGTDVPLAEHEAMFDALLDGLVLNGKSASVAQATPTGLSPAPQTAPPPLVRAQCIVTPKASLPCPSPMGGACRPPPRMGCGRRFWCHPTGTRCCSPPWPFRPVA